VFTVEGASPPEISSGGEARLREQSRVVIFDTAGRLAIDEPLMAELGRDQEADEAERESSSSSTR